MYQSGTYNSKLIASSNLLKCQDSSAPILLPSHLLKFIFSDAIKLAKDAQTRIKPAVSDAVQVCFLLQLGSAITESNTEVYDNNREEK